MDSSGDRLLHHLRRFGPRVLGLGSLRAITLVGAAIGTRILTEATDPQVFGEFKLIAGISILFTGVLATPLTVYAMRRHHDADTPTDTKTFTAEARKSVTAVGAAVGLLSVPVSLIVAVIFDWPALAVAGAAVGAMAFADSLLSIERGLLISRGRVVVSAGYDAGSAVLLPFAVAVAAILLTDDASVGMAVAQALFMFAGAIWLRTLTKGGHPLATSWDWIRRSIPYTAPLALVGGLAWLFNIGDRYLLASLASAEEVGAYAAAYGLAAAPLAALGGLLPVIAYEPLFRSASTRDEEHRRSMSRHLFAYQSAFALIGVVVILLAAPLAVRLLLAEDFREGSVSIVRWVAIGQGFQLAARALDLDSYSTSKTRRPAMSYVAAVAVALLLNLLLIPRFGSLGAAYATAASGLTYLAAMLALTFVGTHSVPRPPHVD